MSTTTLLPRPHPAVLCRRVDDGAVLLQMHDEVYFGLNRVGLQIWEMMPPECGDLDTLCGRLAQLYPEIPADSLRGDVLELLEQLRAAKLVVDPV